MKKILLLLLATYAYSGNYTNAIDNSSEILKNIRNTFSHMSVDATLTQDLAQSIHNKHSEFAQEIRDLYTGIQEVFKTPNNQKADESESKVGASGGKNKNKKTPSQPSNTSHKSNNSENWKKTNLAMGAVLFVFESGDFEWKTVTDINNQFIYDSKSCDTHNTLPNIESCKDQWKTYNADKEFLGKTDECIHLINSTKNDIKQEMEAIIPHIITNPDAQESISSLDRLQENIKGSNGIDSLFNGYYRSWHSEQRIIYDIDRMAGRWIHEYKQEQEKNIKAVIACVHTRLAPCITTPPSVNCHNTLLRWSQNCEFKKYNFQTSMIVSYQSEYEKNCEKTNDNEKFMVTRTRKFSVLNEPQEDFYQYKISLYIQNSQLDRTQQGENARRWLFETSSYSYHRIQNIDAYDSLFVSDILSLLGPHGIYVVNNQIQCNESELNIKLKNNTLYRINKKNENGEFTVMIINDIYNSPNSNNMITRIGGDLRNPIQLTFLTSDPDIILLLKFLIFTQFKSTPSTI